MLTKYNFDIDNQIIIKAITRLTNQIWKLLPMRENGEDWQRQLDTMIIEITGLNEIFIESPFFLQVLSKLEGLKIKQRINFEIYRKTIFEIIGLIQILKGEISDE